jgi:signal transduction histidine kinase
MRSLSTDETSRGAPPGPTGPFERLHTIAGVLCRSQLDLGRVVQRVLDETTELLGAQSGVFFDASNSMPPTWVSSGSEDLATLHVPLDAAALTAFARRGITRSSAPTSYLAAPLVTRSGRALGGYVLTHADASRFTVDHEAMLADIAALTAASVENALLYREAREAEAAQARRADEVAVAAEIGLRFTRGGALRDVLDDVCRAVVEHLDVSTAAIWTAGDTLELQASAGAPPPAAEEQLRRIAASRAPRIVEPRAGAPAFVGYPLLVEDRMLGVFGVWSPDVLARSTFDALSANAAMIAIGIERARSDLDREALVRELSETVRLTELFTGVLAHDLRNPLGAIVAGTQLLQLRVTDEQMRRPLERVQASAERISRLVDQLLDVAKLRVGGGFMVSPAAADLQEISRQVVDELLTANPGRRIDVVVHGDTRGTWDRDRLQQALSNLLGNALTHGIDGAPVSIRVDGRDARTVVIEVTNRGAVPEALRPHIFDPFHVGRLRERGRRDGLGLGLFITKQVVLAHGGTIELRASDGDTTSMVVQLPRAS